MNSLKSRWGLLAAYLLLLAALTLTSTVRLVGDGGEYLVMAIRINDFPRPSPFVHFWFYPALAAPFVHTFSLFGFQPVLGFTALNLVLIATAFWIASGALDKPALLLLFVSPVVWWIDKAHTEVFTFSLLAGAFVILGEPRFNPGWAILCLGMAATQNPPIGMVAAVLIVILRIARRVTFSDRRFIVLSALGFALAALHPAYFWLTSGRLSPLTGFTHRGVPNIDELLAVVRDSNVGLASNAPLLVLSGVLIVGLLVVRSPRRLVTVDVGCSLCATALFLVSFAETTNINHGATPGMSRYALWLIPLMIPFLRQFTDLPVPTMARIAVVGLVAGSAVWSVVAFHPRWPQDYDTPSRFARWLWSNHPGLDRPVPEVFIERLRGGDARWWLPTATPQCEKILLMGRGPGVPMWPVPCAPMIVPAACQKMLVMCYANRSGTGYSFSRVPRPSFWRYFFDRDGVWTEAESQVVAGLLQRLKWWDMRICNGDVIRASFGVNREYNYCAQDRLFVYMKNPQPGATLNIRLPARMSGSFVDAATGEEVGSAIYDGEPGQLWTLAVPDGHVSLALVMKEPHATP